MFRNNLDSVEEKRNGSNALPKKLIKKLGESTDDNLIRRHQRANCFAFFRRYSQIIYLFYIIG